MRGGYTIRASHQFEQDQAEVFGDVARADEFVFGVDWEVSRRPYQGCHVTEDLWCKELVGSDCEVLLFYSIDEANKTVTFRRLVKYGAPEEE